MGVESKSECTRCGCSMCDEDRGQWREELCGECEGNAVTAAIARLNANVAKVSKT